MRLSFLEDEMHLVVNNRMNDREELERIEPVRSKADSLKRQVRWVLPAEATEESVRRDKPRANSFHGAI